MIDNTMMSPRSLRAQPFVGLPDYMGAEVEDLWNAWRMAQAEAEEAYRAWRLVPAGRPAGHDLFAVYQAALDREEQAAVVVAGALRAA
jgi:hypothetical protein